VEIAYHQTKIIVVHSELLPLLNRLSSPHPLISEGDIRFEQGPSPMNLKPGLRLLAETPGTGRCIGPGDRVTIRLQGRLNRGEPIQTDYVTTVVVGRRTLIPGIEYSLVGMRVGGSRRVQISPHLAYGEVGIPGRIPPRAALRYDIEVLAAQPEMPESEA
jgi:FKBP-type peptidyl-prolyl cis-trans isomerase